MKLLVVPAVIGSMVLGARASAAVRRWADRREENHGWCSTLSRDYPRDQRPPDSPAPPSKSK